jgi:hypothetical protein
VDAGDIGIFEAADVVVPDEIQARPLFTLQEGISLEVEGRVPVLVLDDLPGGEVPIEVGMLVNRAEHG